MMYQVAVRLRDAWGRPAYTGVFIQTWVKAPHMPAIMVAMEKQGA